MCALQTEANVTSGDPYKDFGFKIKVDGHYVAGVSKVGGLTAITNPKRASAAQSTYGAITLEDGVTHDAAFEQWANKVWDYKNSNQSDPAISLKGFRKDIIIEVFNETGQKVVAYNVRSCWPSEFQGIAETDREDNAVAIRSINLQHEGWNLDSSAAEPGDVSFTD